MRQISTYWSFTLSINLSQDLPTHPHATGSYQLGCVISGLLWCCYLDSATVPSVGNLRSLHMRGNNIFYIIGVIVVVVFVLKFLGLW